MVLEMPVKAGVAGVALDIAVRPGLPAAIDQACAGADPRHAFLRRAWFEAAGGEATTLIAARADGRVVAALPLVRPRPLLRAVPGSYWPFRSFPIDADASDAELAELLAAPVARRALGLVWRLGPVYEQDPTASRLIDVAAAAGWRILTRRLGTCYRIDIDAQEAEGSWPRSSTLRKNRWIERRLAELGELDWRTASGGNLDGGVLDTLAEIERNSWVWKNTDRRGAKFATPEARRAWETVLADPLLAEMASAAWLSIGGTPAAFSVSIGAGRTRYFLANGYDECFAAHSLGRALLYREFQRVKDEGVREISWGSGDSGYKTEMGAVAGPQIIDLLFVRSRPLAALLRPIWERKAG
jgi:CelD/BcsL family acetyltransferase involved in cellulose biosynthesis